MTGIYRDDLIVDEAAGIRGEEQTGIGDILRRALACRGKLHGSHLVHNLSAKGFSVGFSFHHPRRDCDTADPLRTKLAGKRECHCI